jgi:hypothetical protein
LNGLGAFSCKLVTNRSLILLFLILALLMQVTPILAEQYSISLIGGRWTSSDLGVVIPATPIDAHDAVLFALNAWNVGQLWFTQHYFPNTSLYNLMESSTGNIVVNFVKGTAAPSDCVPFTWHNRIIFAAITLAVMDNYGKPVEWDLLQKAAVHEFGHALGLGHSDYYRDIMFATIWTMDRLPSTLDLYAVHLLAEGVTSGRVTLPPSIPYTTPPARTIPEFPVAADLVLLACVTAIPLCARIFTRRAGNCLDCRPAC